VTNADAWHSNLDTYERVLEADAQQAAIVVAALLHDLSLRERTLLRFPGGQMPAAEGPAPSMHPAANET
jgi:hypothetical protein